MEKNNFTQSTLFTFYLNGDLFGIDITVVKEINRNFDYTPIPDGPSQVIGLLNMRGQVVTIFNLAHFLGFSQRNEGDIHACVILKNTHTHSDYTGFLIDQAGFVVEVDEDKWETAPANINQQDNKLINKVVKLENDLIMVIDSQILFNQYDELV